MADGVLLDTSFLISFVDPRPERVNHETAVRYYRHFIAEGIPMFLSTIAASEFHQKQAVTDLPLDHIIVLPFNLDDAMRAAELNRTYYEKTDETPRDVIKDDFKLLGQLKSSDISYVITEDARTLTKFCERLRANHALRTRPILLSGGFQLSHFDPNLQDELHFDIE